MSKAERIRFGKLTEMGCILVDEQDSHFLGMPISIDYAGYVRVYLGGRKFNRLHRLIMNPGDGFVVDHINRNKLDNRRENLRVCKQADNTKNSSIRADNVSGKKGVWWSTERKKWCVQIQTNGKRRSLGRFDSLEAAMTARSTAEKELWGEYASGD